jgi:hypothetical protein
MEALGLPVKAIKYARAPEPMPLGQNHLRTSDRQPCPAATTARPHDAATGVGAHANPEAGNPLALAASSFQGAFGHVLEYSANYHISQAVAGPKVQGS